MNKTLRLLITKDCNRNCAGCCNKQWDLDKLPIVGSFDEFDEIILTGGEPLLNYKRLFGIIEEIRSQTKAPIYVYTAKVRPYVDFLSLLLKVDGVTLTLHESKDFTSLAVLNQVLVYLPDFTEKKSLRLNIFKEVEVPKDTDLSFWKVKSDIEWIENCPLPENEVFMRWPNE